MARENKIRREYDLIFHFFIKCSYGLWSKIISEKDHNSYCLCKIEMIVFMTRTETPIFYQNRNENHEIPVLCTLFLILFSMQPSASLFFFFPHFSLVFCTFLPFSIAVSLSFRFYVLTHFFALSLFISLYLCLIHYISLPLSHSLYLSTFVSLFIYLRLYLIHYISLPFLCHSLYLSTYVSLLSLQADNRQFQVRIGPEYSRFKKKAPSASPLFEAFAVDVFW